MLMSYNIHEEAEEFNDLINVSSYPEAKGLKNLNWQRYF